MGEQGGGELVDVGSDQMVGHDVAEEIEPEEGHLSEDAAFVGNALGEDAVEGGDAVGGDDEKVVTGSVNVANFAAGKFLYSRELSGCDDGRHFYLRTG